MYHNWLHYEYDISNTFSEFCYIMTNCVSNFLNQAHASLWPVGAWFLFGADVSRCVCPPQAMKNYSREKKPE